MLTDGNMMKRRKEENDNQSKNKKKTNGITVILTFKSFIETYIPIRHSISIPRTHSPNLYQISQSKTFHYSSIHLFREQMKHLFNENIIGKRKQKTENKHGHPIPSLLLIPLPSSLPSPTTPLHKIDGIMKQINREIIIISSLNRK